MRKIGFWKGIFCFKKQACGNPGPKGRFLGEGNGNREAAESFCSGVNIMDCRTGCGWRFLLIDYYSQCQSLSHVQLFVAPWTVAHQAALSMGFSRQECWCGFAYPPPKDLPDQGIEPKSPEVSCIGRCVLYYQCYLGSPLRHYYVPAIEKMRNKIFA